jgi:hypothetical protein
MLCLNEFDARKIDMRPIATALCTMSVLLDFVGMAPLADDRSLAVFMLNHAISWLMLRPNHSAGSTGVNDLGGDQINRKTVAALKIFAAGGRALK